MKSYAQFCYEQRRQFQPKAHGRADYEARIVWHSRESQKYLVLSREAFASDSWDANMSDVFLKRAKWHRRHAIGLMRAGNRGEGWSDSTPERWLVPEEWRR